MELLSRFVCDERVRDWLVCSFEKPDVTSVEEPFPCTDDSTLAESSNIFCLPSRFNMSTSNERDAWRPPRSLSLLGKVTVSIAVAISAELVQSLAGFRLTYLGSDDGNVDAVTYADA